jgi:hypothetical protein
VGNVCGYDRKEVLKELENFYFGAAYISGEPVEENVTFIQFKKEGGKYRSGVVKVQIYNSSEYLLIVAGKENELKEKIMNKIKIIKSDPYKDDNGIWYLIKMKRYPYGGQNDFFVKEVRVMDKMINVEEKEEIDLGYVPYSILKNVDKNTKLEILPVRIKNGMEYFVFVKKGKAFLKEKVLTALGIPIYKVNDFYYL